MPPARQGSQSRYLVLRCPTFQSRPDRSVRLNRVGRCAVGARGFRHSRPPPVPFSPSARVASPRLFRAMASAQSSSSSRAKATACSPAESAARGSNPISDTAGVSGCECGGAGRSDLLRAPETRLDLGRSLRISTAKRAIPAEGSSSSVDGRGRAPPVPRVGVVRLLRAARRPTACSPRS